MTMELNRKDNAVELHKKGYNCAQSVACNYCDLFGMDEETVFRLTEGFGFGCGMKEICGAVTGAIAVIGMNNSSGNVERGITKKSTYDQTSALGKKFADMNGSILCSELKGGPDKEALRSCEGCIEDACVLVEEYLKEAYKGDK